MMNTLKSFNKQEILFFLSLTLFLFLIDKIVKLWVVKNLILYYDYIYIMPFLELRYILNTGVSFGLFNNLPYQVVTILSIIACFLAIYLVIGFYLKKSLELILVISFLLSGSLGNITDRFLYKGVVDYIHFYLGDYSFPIFNLADCFITFSSLIIIKNVIMESVRKK